MKHPPPELRLGEFPSEEERHALANWLVRQHDWQAPAASVDDAHKAFCADLDTITFIAQVTGLAHARVRIMRDEHLADVGTLQQEQQTRGASFRRMRERTRLSINVFYRRQRDHAARKGTRVRPRQRTREHRPGAARRASSSSTTSSSDPGDGDSELAEPPAPARLTLAPPPKAILTFGFAPEADR